MSTWTLRIGIDALVAGEDLDARARTFRIDVNTTVRDDTLHRLLEPTGEVVAPRSGWADVQLPANDVAPGTFGFVVTRRGTRDPKRWQVPTQPAGTVRYLSEFTATTALPVPAGFDAQLDAIRDLTDPDLAASLSASFARYVESSDSTAPRPTGPGVVLWATPTQPTHWQPGDLWVAPTS